MLIKKDTMEGMLIHEVMDAMKEVLTRLDRMEGKIDSQTEQIRIMNEAFDLIMRDYFTTLAESVKAAMELAADGNMDVKELKERVGAVAKTMDLVSLRTAALSGEENRKLYEETIPELRKEIALIGNKVQGMWDQLDGFERDAGKAFNDLGADVGRSLRIATNEIHQRLTEIHRGLNQKIDVSAKEVKIAANPNSRNNYYR